MLFSLEANFYSFVGILCLCAYFFLSSFSLSKTYRAADALSQPVETLQIVPGHIQAVRHVEEIAVIFPTTERFVDYTYQQDGRLKTRTFECYWTAACLWLEPGPADILVAENGRYTIPMALSKNLKAHKGHLKRRIRIGTYMSLLTLALTMFCGFQLFRRKPKF